MQKEGIKDYFLTGFFTLLPLFVTLFIFYYLYNLVFNILVLFPTFDLPYKLGIILNIVVMLFLITMLGGVMRVYFGRRMHSYIERKFLIKIPIFGMIYDSTKQLLQVLSDKERSKLLKAVYVEYPRKGIYSIGFVTKESEKINGKEMISVLVPTSPTPLSGMLIYVKKSEIIDANISVKDALKIIAFGGIVGKERS